jgi:hypothetical protein
MVLRIRGRRLVEEPLPETRFDRWPAEDVYTAVETAIGEVTHLLDSYRACDAQQKAWVLSQIQTKLSTAKGAITSMQRRVANDKPL